MITFVLDETASSIRLPDMNCQMQVSDIQKGIDTQLEKAKELFQ